MPELILELGLTDVVDDPSMTYSDDCCESEDITICNYNLRSQGAGLEKTKVRYVVKTQIPAVMRAIDKWEDCIRRPHLKYIQYTLQPFKLMPEYPVMTCDMKFVSFVPLSGDWVEYTEEDFKHFTPDNGEFGWIYMHPNDAYVYAGVPYEETYDNAVMKNDLTRLNPDALPVSVPSFRLQFNLKGQESKFHEMTRLKEFKHDNEKKLRDAGLDPSNWRLTYGKLPFAQLADDAWEAYEKFRNYPRICRFSLIKEEDNE
jgi:hypothetical protein